MVQVAKIHLGWYPLQISGLLLSFLGVIEETENLQIIFWQFSCKRVFRQHFRVNLAKFHISSSSTSIAWIKYYVDNTLKKGNWRFRRETGDGRVERAVFAVYPCKIQNKWARNKQCQNLRNYTSAFVREKNERWVEMLLIQRGNH